MLTFLRWWAVLLGSSLMLGEAIRSWGQDRHLIWVLDDFVIGIPLVVTGLLLAAPTPARRYAFSAAWAGTAGMLYSSFFGKLLEPARPVDSNIETGFLTLLIGLAFASSLIGLAGSVIAKPST